MLFDEALRELGLDRPVPSGEVRRAYLKKVKVHPPETDAEGFARVREAFEIVNEVAKMRDAAMRAAEPPPERPRAREEKPVVEDKPAEARTDEAPVAEAPVMRWWLAGETAKKDASGASVEDPPAKDETSAKEEARAKGAEEEPAPPKRPASDASVAEARARIRPLLDGGDFKAAAPLVIEDIDASLAAMRDPFVTPIGAVRIALELQALGAFGWARKTIQAVERQATAAGGDIHLFKQADLVKWMLVREISALKDALSKSARMSIARASLAGDPATAARWMRSLDDVDVRMLRTVSVSERAPVVHGMFGRYFAPPPQPQQQYYRPRQQQRTGWWGGLGGGAFVLLSLFRVLAHSGGSCGSDDGMRRTEFKSTPYVAPNQGAANGTNRSTTTPDRADRTWDSLWSDGSAQPSASGSSSASPVERALASKNCEAARRALLDLRATDKLGKSPATDALGARVARLCNETK